MRPSKLTLEGFTSFVDRAEIDFSDLDLFAIIGPTGSGKTSLLDAITWVLYGKTPRLGKTSTELISHSAKKMAVYLEFTVGTQRYRAGRTARRSGSPVLNLEHFDGEWTALETGSAADMNAALVKIVGLDFDAFTRSVMLPQGKFDAFLRGEHKVRREILKSLLGLEVYDRMRELAVLRRDQFQAKEDAFQTVIERDYGNATQEFLSGLEAERRGLRKEQKENAALTKRVEALWGIGDALARARTSLADREVSVKAARAEHLKLGEAVQLKAAEVDRISGALRTAQAECEAVVIDEGKHAEFLKLNEVVKSAAKWEASKAAAQVSLAGARLQLAERRSALDAAEHAKRNEEAAALLAAAACGSSGLRWERALTRGSADHLTALIELAGEIPARNRSIDELQDERLAIAAERERMAAQAAAYRAELPEMQIALEQAKGELDVLKKHEAHHELRAGLRLGEACPVCEQTVPVLPKVNAPGQVGAASRLVNEIDSAMRLKQNALAKMEAQLAEVPRRLRDIDLRVGEVTAAVHAMRKKFQAVTGPEPDADCVRLLRAMVAEIHAAEDERKQNDAEQKKADQAVLAATKAFSVVEKEVVGCAAEVGRFEGDVKRLTEEIEAVRPGIEAAGGAARIEAELAAIDSARERKTRLTVQIAKLGKDRDAAADVKTKAETSVAVLADRIASLTAAIEKLAEELEVLAGSWAKGVSGLELPAGKDEKDQAGKKREQLRAERDEIAKKLGALDASIEAARSRIEQVGKLRADLDEAKTQRSLYEQLAHALRANQLIDYLLETAYAGLCEKGSEHLLRLSGERYSFTAGKSEFCVKDAWNADAERSASTLSGGESFLASLALALALADSVASFGGDGNQAARLDALFLDEGVSALDQDEALPAVIDALTSLQSADRMIGVISHMENLAERLPSRIEIVKDHGRSSLKVTDAAYLAAS